MSTNSRPRVRVALLRGINVGGHRRVPMGPLRSALEVAGLSDVRTYIQSGNVVFAGGPVDSGVAATLIVDVVRAEFGHEVAVCVRSRGELEEALATSTRLFPPEEVDVALPHDKRVHVGFLSSVPASSDVDAIDPLRSVGDRVAVKGAEAHLYYAAGAGLTKLTGHYLERVLRVSMTARNLVTVRKLIDLSAPVDS